jgi:hypothetical protein
MTTVGAFKLYSQPVQFQARGKIQFPRLWSVFVFLVHALPGEYTINEFYVWILSRSPFLMIKTRYSAHFDAVVHKKRIRYIH